MQMADEYMPPLVVRDDSLRPNYQPQRKLTMEQRVAEPRWEKQDVLRKSARAPPNPAAVASLCSGLVNFDPQVPLNRVKSDDEKKNVAVCRRAATNGFEKIWKIDVVHPYPTFWVKELPASIYECQEIALYDNRRVDPDWSERAKTSWHRVQRFFDVNGIKKTPNMVARELRTATGEAPPLDQDLALSKTICDCPHKVRAALKTMKALIDHFLQDHGIFICYSCHMTFTCPIYLHGHLC